MTKVNNPLHITEIVDDDGTVIWRIDMLGMNFKNQADAVSFALDCDKAFGHSDLILILAKMRSRIVSIEKENTFISPKQVCHILSVFVDEITSAVLKESTYEERKFN